jgi:glycerol kinase
MLAGLKSGLWNMDDIDSVREVEKVFVPHMDKKIRKEKYKGWLESVERTKTPFKSEKKPNAKRFSILDREEQLSKAALKKFDLVVIGGGITGAGIALDAASRGLKICLIEKNDFASGTSNKSTKLIHGGLRYLKQMEIGLVKESGRERAIVHKLAPHLVIPEKMLLPLIEGGTYGKMMTSIGLKVYDLLASVEGDDRRKMLDREETLLKEPLLNSKTVLGGGYYSEYRTDDARLTIELLKKASEMGATVINYCEMDEFIYSDEHKIVSVQCIDHNSGERIKIRARNFVSAAGPWVDLLRKKDASINNKRLHLTKGVHIVFPFEKLPIHQSIYFDVPDGRMLFAIPRGKVTYVGTTDTDYYGNIDHVVTTKVDVDYLLEGVNATFPNLNLKIKDVKSSWAGLRPLIHEDEKAASDLSRKDEIFVSKSGLISIAGGKLTGYRKMAQRVLETVINTMSDKRKSTFKESHTETIKLTSPSMKTSMEVEYYRNELTLKLKAIRIIDSYYSWYLTSTFGRQSDIIFNKTNFFHNKHPEERLIRAELWYCIHYEMTNSLADFFVRRTGKIYFDIESVYKYESIVVNDCIQYLDWDEPRVQKELDILHTLLKDATTFYDNELD